MGRPKRDMEATFYDCFSKWTKDDREAALKILQVLHRSLPDKPVATSRPAETLGKEEPAGVGANGLTET
jgi:hypothetical protein